MAVAIDDRVIELGANLGWGKVGVTAHGSSGKLGIPLSLPRQRLALSLHRRLSLGNRFHERRSAMRAWQKRHGVGAPAAGSARAAGAPAAVMGGRGKPPPSRRLTAMLPIITIAEGRVPCSRVSPERRSRAPPPSL